jgi:large subunit ribosomal protein L24
MAKLHIRKDDQVVIIAGKDKGKKGQVKRTFPQSQRVIVHQANMVKKAMRPTQDNPRGGISEQEAPLHISNVKLVCPKCDAPTRVGIKKNADGVRVRFCKKCGAEID